MPSRMFAITMNDSIIIGAGPARRKVASLPIEHLETHVPRLFAAGDVLIGLDQVSHAMAMQASPPPYPPAEQHPLGR